MSIFGKVATRDKVATGTQVVRIEDRDRKGPLPVVRDLVVMVARLSSERERVIAGQNGCCIVLCTPDQIPGFTMEQSVQTIAERFAGSLRGYDSIFRYGRNKILICLPFVAPREAESVMGRLREIAIGVPIHMPGQRFVTARVSLGGAMMSTIDVQDTINRADRALEQGRMVGGSTVCMWTPDMF